MPNLATGSSPRDGHGRAPLQSRRGLKSFSELLLQRPPAGSACSKRLGALNSSPQTGVWGRAPSLMVCSALLTFLKFLVLDHDQVKILGGDPAGLQPP